MRFSKVLMLVVLAGFTVVWSGGCASEDKEADEMLKLNWRAFDQSSETGWRPYADQKNYVRAIELIEHYLKNREGLEQGEAGYLHFHAAVLLSWEDHDDRAIAHLRNASVDSFPEGFPQTWNAVVSGTLGFMLKDMEAVRSARDEIVAMSALSARDSSFLEGMEYLVSKEGMSYKEATLEWQE